MPFVSSELVLEGISASLLSCEVAYEQNTPDDTGDSESEAASVTLLVVAR